MNWTLTLVAHWPHDRFALGFESLPSTEEVPFHTIQLFLLIFTIRLDMWHEDEY
jgi:hypothetical protein